MHGPPSTHPGGRGGGGDHRACYRACYCARCRPMLLRLDVLCVNVIFCRLSVRASRLTNFGSRRVQIVPPFSYVFGASASSSDESSPMLLGLVWL